ncbi:hypothetical protein VV02_14955 [Luteipulveratus mongoliensis]|uniref:Uncharacterized protein n=1 Tax=Luteipulveratus mongoliensis TaxID=571913 RepID=A0A0K1JJV4_9MICO|nr:hypothetical protein VV02_14955 [Luteipulveratus mongoliensis]
MELLRSPLPCRARPLPGPTQLIDPDVLNPTASRRQRVPSDLEPIHLLHHRVHLSLGVAYL